MKYWVFIIFLLSFFEVRFVHAQIGSNPYSVSIAGGGVSIVNGPSSISFNPANLMINSYRSGNIFEFGSFSFTSPSGYLSQDFDEMLYRWAEPIFMDSLLLNPKWRERLRYNEIKDKHEYITKRTTDINLFGMSFANKSWAWGIQAKNRSFSYSAISSHYFIDYASQINPNKTRSFNQTNLNWNELSLGFATNLNYVEGLSSSFNKIYFGLSASYLLPYSYLEVSSSDSFLEKEAFYTVRNNAVTSAGNATHFIDNLRFGNTDPYQQVRLNQENIKNQIGWGTSISVGLTYEVPFEASYNEVREHLPVKRAFRLSASITDIGFIQIKKDLQSLELKSDTLLLNRSDNAPHFSFVPGAGFGDLSYFFSQSNVLQLSKHVPRNTLTIVLPMQAHLGASFSYNWFKLGADAHYGLNKNMGNESFIWTSLFSELSVLPILPIRAGVLTRGFEIRQLSAGLSLQLLFFAWDIGVAYDFSKDLDYLRPSFIAGTTLKVRF